MKFLLLVAHGSRQEVANDEIRVLAKQLQAIIIHLSRLAVHFWK